MTDSGIGITAQYGGVMGSGNGARVILRCGVGESD